MPKYTPGSYRNNVLGIPLQTCLRLFLIWIRIFWGERLRGREWSESKSEFENRNSDSSSKLTPPPIQIGWLRIHWFCFSRIHQTFVFHGIHSYQKFEFAWKFCINFQNSESMFESWDSVFRRILVGILNPYQDCELYEDFESVFGFWTHINILIQYPSNKVADFESISHSKDSVFIESIRRFWISIVIVNLYDHSESIYRFCIHIQIQEFRF